MLHLKIRYCFNALKTFKLKVVFVCTTKFYLCLCVCPRREPYCETIAPFKPATQLLICRGGTSCVFIPAPEEAACLPSSLLASVKATVSDPNQTTDVTFDRTPR